MQSTRLLPWFCCRETSALQRSSAAPNVASRSFRCRRPWCGTPQFCRHAFLAFSESKEYQDFVARNSWWLEPYVNFMALLQANRNEPWNTFDARRKPSAQAARYHSFLQFEFFRQWAQFRKYCRERDISILGDLPFYIEYNSADVWSHPAHFDLDENHRMRSVGSVPPDYFSADGQRWGSPTYRWDRIAQRNFRWWIDRFRFAFEHLDLLRVDHFRGFEAFWSV